MRGVVAALVAAAILAAAPASAQKFYPDDPLLVDRDDLDIPPPAEIELSGGWDMIENTFGFGPPPARPGTPAANVNTLGEVPDSSWFTNRIGQRALSLDDLRRGPDTRGGPQGSWTVIRGKSEGVTPGFTIRDERGLVYFVKFDPPEWPNMATAADVIGTKFFHAIGYSVPENYIAYLRREQVVLSPDARISGGGRRDAPMTESDLEDIFSRAFHRDDGTIRVVASLALEGRPLGPHKWFGTRSDDPNDVFPHEDRREARGYRVFCAWLNHDDSRGNNTLDVLVERGGRRFVRHHLIDFASALGSGSTRPQGRRGGNEYLFDWGPFARAALTLGLWDRPWRDVEYADLPEVGRIEASYFRPERWKPEYPNAAFQRMDAEDAFWAARIVSRFSDEAIAAIVETGDYDDPASTRHLTRVLAERRDKIAAHYFRQLDPLAEFAVERGAQAGWRLRFEHLGVRAGLGDVTGYDYEWFRFDNQTRARTSILRGEAETAGVAIPDDPAAFLMVRLRSLGSAEPRWGNAVDVYLRGGDPPSLVGIEREH